MFDQLCADSVEYATADMRAAPLGSSGRAGGDLLSPWRERLVGKPVC